MRRATAWSVRGVDRSTQEIAEEAARRAGMSLGDWLDAVVAERAAEQGVASEDLEEEDKLDAIGERLSRLTRRDDGSGTRRRGEQRPRDAGPTVEKVSPEDALLARERLEAAIARFESRAAKSEERTAKAFESVASWIERSQADRLEERETLQTVAEKIGAIETRAQREAERLRAAAAAEKAARERAVQSQIDARLDALSRRVAAAERAPARVAPPRAEPETQAPSREPAADVEPPAARDSVVDERLAELTRRVEAAERARSEPAPPPARPKLDVREAVEQIARRRVDSAPRPAAPAESKVAAPPKSGWRNFGVDVDPAKPVEPTLPEPSRPSVDTLREQMAALEARLAKLRAPRPDRRPADAETADIRAGLAAMSRSVANLAPRNASVALEGAVDDLGQRLSAAREAGANESLIAPIEAMTRQVLDALRERDPRAAASALEREIRALGVKIDALAGTSVEPELLERIRRQSDEVRSLLASAAKHPVPVERLERQIGQLADRIEHIANSPAPRAEIVQILRLLSETHAQIEQATPTAVLEAIERHLEQLAARIDDAVRRPPPAIDTRPIEELARRVDGLRATIDRRADDRPDLAPLEAALREINAKLDRAPEGAVDSQALMSSLQGMNARLEETLRQPRVASVDPRPIEDLARRIESVRASVERKADFAPLAAKLEAALGEIGAKLRSGVDPKALTTALQGIARLEESYRQPRIANIDPKPIEELARRIDGVRATVERTGDFTPHAAKLEAALSDIRAKLEAGADSKAIAAALQGLNARWEESFRQPRVANIDPKPIEELARRIDGVRATVERKADFAPHAAKLEAALGDIKAKLEAGADSMAIATALQGMNARWEESLRQPRIAKIDSKPIEDLARQIDGVRATIERKGDFAPHAARLEAALGDLSAKLDRPPPPAAAEPTGLNSTLRDLTTKLEETFRRPTVAAVDPRPLEDLGRRIDEMRATVERQAGRGADASQLQVLREIAAKLDRVAASPAAIDQQPLDDLARRIEDVRATVVRHTDQSIDANELKAALGEIAGKLDRQAAAAPVFDPGMFDAFARRFDDVHAALAEHAARRPDSAALESTLRDLAARLEHQAATPVPVDARPLEDLARRIDEVRATMERQAGRSPDASELKAALGEIAAKLDRLPNSPVMLDARPLEELAQRIEDVRAALERQGDPRLDASELQAALRDIGDKLDRQAESTHHLDPWAIDDIVRRIEDVRTTLEHRFDQRPDLSELSTGLREIGDKLDRQAASPVELDPRALEDLASRIDHMRATLERQVEHRPDLSRLDETLRDISAKLDHQAVSADESHALLDLMRELAERVETGAAAGFDTTGLERAVRDLGERPVEIDTRPFESLLHELGDKIAAIPSASHDNEPIERMLAQVDAKLDDIARSTTDTRPLELAIHDLNQKLSQIPEPVLDSSLIEHAAEMLSRRLEKTGATALDAEALVNQISEIHGRLDTFDISSSSNAALERAVTELIEELETTRQVVQSTSAQPSTLAPLIGGISELRAEQAVSDRKMENRLSSVQGILEKLADRLSRVEELADRDGAKDVKPAPIADFDKAPQTRPGNGGMTARNTDPRDIPDRDHRETPNILVAPSVRPTRDGDVLLEPGAGAPGRNAAINAHIAAARRAAQSALAEQSEKEQSSSNAQRKANPRLQPTGQSIAQARSLFVKHRKPILLGATAAALTVAATVAVVELRGGHPKGIQKSELTTPTSGSPSGPESPTKTPGTVDYRPTGALDATPAKPAATVAAPAKPAPDDMTAALPVTLPEALRDAAKAGDPGAETEIALRYLDGRTVARDAKLAARWFELAATQGLPTAQYRLAALYEKGTGVARDLNLARAWYLKGATAGNARAMHNLAVLDAQDGGAGKPDYAEAANWFRHAAELGIRDSQFNLAVLSGRGLGVPQDLASSWMWFSLASRQGDADAAKKRDEVAAKMDSATLAAAEKALSAFKLLTPDPKANETPAPAGGWDAKASAPQAARPAPSSATRS